MFKFITLLSSLLLVSCVTFVPYINSNSPIDIYGVTFLPPQNGSWLVMAASGYQSTLASKGVLENESLVVNVSIFQLPELDSDEGFLDFIAKSRASSPDIGRFENKENTESLSSLNGAVCVKYHTLSNDMNAKIQGGKAQMVLESIGYNCRHPEKNSIGVVIEYSFRHFGKSEHSSLEKDSDAFFKNIQFREF